MMTQRMASGSKVLINGDFYTLQQSDGDAVDWAAWQYHLASDGVGVSYYFRKSAHSASQIEAALNHIKVNEKYKVEIYKSCHLVHVEVMSGATLREMKITIHEALGSVFVQYAMLSHE